MSLYLKIKLKKISHVVSVDATVTRKVDKFGLQLHSVIDETYARDLAARLGIDDHKGCRIVYALATALNGVYQSIMEASSLEIVGVIAVELSENVFLGQNYLFYAEFLVDLAVCKLGKIKLEKAGLVCGIACNEAVVFAVFGVDGEVSKGAHISALTGLARAPKLAVVSKSDLDDLNKSALEAVAISLNSVDTANAPSFVFLSVVGVIKIGVEQGEFIILCEFFVAKADCVGVGAELFGSVELEGGLYFGFSVLTGGKIVKIVYEASSVSFESEQGASEYATVLAAANVSYLFEIEIHIKLHSAAIGGTTGNR